MEMPPGHFSNDEVCLSATNHTSRYKGFFAYHYRGTRGQFLRFCSPTIPFCVGTMRINCGNEANQGLITVDGRRGSLPNFPGLSRNRRARFEHASIFP